MPYVNKDQRKYNIPLNLTHIPKPKTKTSREKLIYQENQTASLIDPRFQEERFRQLAEIKQQRDLQGKKVTVKDKMRYLTYLVTTQDEANRLADPVTRIQDQAQWILFHLDVRIHAFLFQVINCFDTPCHFTIGVTQLQTESTSAVHLIPGEGVIFPEGMQTVVPFASAHHGTLPCIWAYHRESWNIWKTNQNPNAPFKPQVSVFHENSQSYLVGNSCVGIEKDVNEADIDLDGNPTEEHVEFSRQKKELKDLKLREFAIGILNQAARREVDPVQGFSLFMTKMKQRVETLLSNQAISPSRREIFNIWKQHLDALEAESHGDYLPLIARQFSIRVPFEGGEPSRDLLRNIFPRHFQALKHRDTYQSQLDIKIKNVKSAILILNQNKKPHKFDLAVKIAMLTEANQHDIEIQKIFKKFFVCSQENINKLTAECLQGGSPAYNLVNTAASQTIIKSFFIDFRMYAINLTIDESIETSAILRTVRLIRGYSLRVFAQLYKQQFPQGTSMSYEQLRRIERGDVRVDAEQMRMFAHILNVHPNVLLPGFVIT